MPSCAPYCIVCCCSVAAADYGCSGGGAKDIMPVLEIINFIGRPNNFVHRLSCQSTIQDINPAVDAEEAHAHAA